MKDCRKFYIDGKWVDPIEPHNFTVISPANEEPIATISLESAVDVDRAVAAAKRAFESYSETTLDVAMVSLTGSTRAGVAVAVAAAATSLRTSATTCPSLAKRYSDPFFA